MIRMLRSERGSTSILVVIFMIVLMIFGLSILTTSISNTRLAEKKRVWLSEYYLLEGYTARELAMLDNIITKNKNETVTDLENSLIDEDARSQVYIKKIIEDLENQGYWVSLLESELEKELVVYLEIKENDSEIPKHLSLDLKLIIPDDLLSDDDFLNNANFEIAGHTEWQKPFDFEESIKFEDPFENPFEEPIVNE